MGSRAPPIKLNMSHSTESAFSFNFEFAKLPNTLSASNSKTLRRDSAHLSPESASARMESREARTRGSSTPMPTTMGLSRGGKAKKMKSAPISNENPWTSNANPFAPKKKKVKRKMKRGNPFRKKSKKK